MHTAVANVSAIADISASSAILAVDPADLLSVGDPVGAGPMRDQSVDFDIKRDLGRKGTRTLDRAAALVVHAVGQLPGVDSGGGGPVSGPDTGVVLATTMGSIQTTMDFTQDTFTGARPYHVDPARFPNTVMNFAAGQCAIRYGLEGPNATVAAGHVGSFTALAYAARLLRTGRARRIVVGASEELSPARQEIERASRGTRWGLGEGAAAVLVEPPGVGIAPIAEIVRMTSGFAVTADDTSDVLRQLLGDLLDPGADRSASADTGAGIGADANANAEADADAGSLRVRVAAPGDASAGSAELTALRGAVGDAAFADVQVVDAAGRTGDVGAVSGLVQLLGAVAALRQMSASGPADCAVVSGTDREGAVQLALIRLPQPRSSE